MKRKYAKLVHIDKNEDVEGYEFLQCMQKGLLLALKEQNVLSEIQYRFAVQRLKEQVARKNISRIKGHDTL